MVLQHAGTMDSHLQQTCQRCEMTGNRWSLRPCVDVSHVFANFSIHGGSRVHMPTSDLVVVGEENCALVILPMPKHN